MGPVETHGVAEGSGGRPPTVSVCRPRLKRLLLLVVAVLVFGQLSLNVLFYRNSESLFYVNTTATTSAAGPLLLDSQLWWTSSRLPWLQPLPVSQPNHTSSLTHVDPGKSRRMVEAEDREKGETEENPPQNIIKGMEKMGGSTTNPHTAKPPAGSGDHSIRGMDSTNAGVNVTLESAAVSQEDDIKVEVDKKSELTTHTSNSLEKTICPPVPPKLVGVVKVNKSAPILEEQERAHPELAPGGHYQPGDCTARHKVAIIIPYRDRVNHLAVLLHHLHPILQRQQVDYTIFVVEQAGTGKFNRAMLMNVGALEALKHYPFNCFIFHDVDLLLEDDRNLYTCPEQPRHMSIAIDTMKYRLPYNDIFGGVSAMTVDQFRTVNGFSNKFWGWGGEDDDMSNRIKHHGFFVSRYPANVGRYTMLTHKKDNPNPRRYQYLHEGKKRYKSDGLNSVKYHTLDTQLRRLYTWVYVDLFPS